MDEFPKDSDGRILLNAGLPQRYAHEPDCNPGLYLRSRFLGCDVVTAPEARARLQQASSIGGGR